VHDPLVDLNLFRLRPYDGALVANLTMNLSFAGLSYLLVLWLQNVRGYDAMEAGLLMLPATLGIFVFIPLGGRMSARVGSRRPVYIGLLIMSAGVLLLGLLREDVSLAVIMGALVITGLGLGMLSTPISNTAVGDVSVDLAGTAAGVFKMSSMVGGALGVALLTAFARSFSDKHIGDAVRVAGLSDAQVDQARQALVSSSSFDSALAKLPQELRNSVTQVAKSAFTDGVADSFVITGIVAVVATVLVVLIWPSRRERAPEATPQPEPDQAQTP
jgi:MFS family permease